MQLDRWGDFVTSFLTSEREEHTSATEMIRHTSPAIVLILIDYNAMLCSQWMMLQRFQCIGNRHLYWQTDQLYLLYLHCSEVENVFGSDFHLQGHRSGAEANCPLSLVLVSSFIHNLVNRFFQWKLRNQPLFVSSVRRVDAFCRSQLAQTRSYSQNHFDLSLERTKLLPYSLELGRGI